MVLIRLGNMSSPSRFKLSSDWKVKAQDWTDEQWLPVEAVPSQIHMDLLANKKIPDPFLDLNERAVQWIAEKTWIYKLDFTIPSPSDPKSITDLVFEGLDTFATVSLNGKEILQSENMFVAHRVNISGTAKYDAVNTLEIVFDSALFKGRQLVEDHKHEHNFYVRQTENSRVPVRKAQYNWGWDWGPILMTAGPWKPVLVEQYTARIDDVWARNTVSEDLKKCFGTIFAKVDGKLSPETKVLVTLRLLDKVVFEKDAAPDTDGLAQLNFEIEDPELWFPFRYGTPTRYELSAKIISASSVEIDAKSRLIGFRRTELVQEPDEYGKSFYFRVNNIDVFAGGSCWIPADSFVSQISAQRYYDWVKLAVDGNQDMLRVWGGGIYEDDAFLDACDELGVMVFHDFQFACANYPTYTSYLENFKVEAIQQIQRFRWRPSVIIWAGNNEDYQVQQRYKLEYDYSNKDAESWLKTTFPARYIYEHLLPELIKEHDPHNLYHPSSPWGDGKPWDDLTVGDMHQWHIWHGNMYKYQEAPKLSARFISEFGMEAYPHLSTIKRAITDPKQLYPGSMALDFRNKAIAHERRLVSYVTENFSMRSDLGEYTHLTQAMQADTMRFAYKSWRRDWGEPGKRKCGGILVWQLNDCWPTMSWAVVDYYLVKKPAFYAIARAMRTVDVGVSRTFFDWGQTTDFVDEFSELYTGQIDHTAPARKGTFDIWIASSRTEEIAAQLTVRFISVCTGKDVCEPIKQSITAGANRTTDIIKDHLLPTSIPNAADETIPFSTTQYDPFVVHASVTLQDGTVVSDVAWPDPIKYLDMSDRGVTFEISPTKDQVTIKSERPVKSFVFEEVQDLKLSDNGFDLVPGEEQTVQVSGALTADQLLWTYIGAGKASLEISKQ